MRWLHFPVWLLVPVEARKMYLVPREVDLGGGCSFGGQTGRGEMEAKCAESESLLVVAEELFVCR